MLLVIAVAAFLINLQRPRLPGIFGQTGVYGLTAAAAPPLLPGVLFNRVPVALLWFGSAAALLIHFGLFFKGAEWFPMSTFTVGNPGVTASLATLVVMPILLIAAAVKRLRYFFSASSICFSSSLVSECRSRV